MFDSCDYFIEVVGDYDPSKNTKSKKYHYLTEREFLENISNIYDPIFDTYTLKNALYIESFGNFSFLPVHCSIYMQDIFIKIGAYDTGPDIFNTNNWLFILSTIPFNTNPNWCITYTPEIIYKYFKQLMIIKIKGWDNWVLMVKSCIKEIEHKHGIY